MSLGLGAEGSIEMPLIVIMLIRVVLVCVGTDEKRGGSRIKTKDPKIVLCRRNTAR